MLERIVHISIVYLVDARTKNVIRLVSIMYDVEAELNTVKYQTLSVSFYLVILKINHFIYP